MSNPIMPIVVTFDQGDNYDVTLSSGDFTVDFSEMHQAGEYQGSYEVTPSSETQVLQTTGKIMSQNVVVNPVPDNYGLISWNGSVITVS